MTLTYDKTNKALSAAAVAAILMLGLIDLCDNISSIAYMMIRYRDIWRILPNMANLLYYVFWLGIPVALLVGRKNILTAFAFVLPIIYTLVLQPLVSDILIPVVLQGRGLDLTNLLLSYLVEFVFTVPMAIFFLAIIISCFTKGKVFGEKAGIVLLLLGILAYLTAVIAPFCSFILTNLIRGGELGRLLRMYFIGTQIDIAVVVRSATYILIALAFWRPNKELIPEQPAEAVTE